MRQIPHPMTADWLVDYMRETDEWIQEPFEEELSEGFSITVYGIEGKEMPIEVELTDKLVESLIDSNAIRLSLMFSSDHKNRYVLTGP